jgi:hypothetical protein
MRANWGELYQAALRCAHTQQVHETCSPSGRKPKVHRATIVSAAGVSTQQTSHSVRRRSAREGFGCGLRPVAAVSGAEAAAAADGAGCVAAASRDCAGMQQVAMRCNGLRCAATDAAACNCRRSDAAGGASLQAALRCNQFRLSGWAHPRGALGPPQGYSRGTLGVL